MTSGQTKRENAVLNPRREVTWGRKKQHGQRQRFNISRAMRASNDADVCVCPEADWYKEVWYNNKNPPQKQPSEKQPPRKIRRKMEARSYNETKSNKCATRARH